MIGQQNVVVTRSRHTVAGGNIIRFNSNLNADCFKIHLHKLCECSLSGGILTNDKAQLEAKRYKNFFGCFRIVIVLYNVITVERISLRNITGTCNMTESLKY